MMKFNVGAKMCFDATRHGMQEGILIKFNQRTVTVLTDEGRQWKVSPQMLSPIVEGASAGINVIVMKKRRFDRS